MLLIESYQDIVGENKRDLNISAFNYISILAEFLIQSFGVLHHTELKTVALNIWMNFTSSQVSAMMHHCLEIVETGSILALCLLGLTSFAYMTPW